MKFAKEPLLYIQQPTVIRPSAPMQHTYSTPKKKAKIESSPQPEKKNPQQPIKRRSSLDAITKEIVHDLKVAPTNEVKPIKTIKRTGKIDLPSTPSPEPTPAQETPSSSQQTLSAPTEQQDTNEEKNERKKFKDMTILEKVLYFIHTPSHLPRMRCEVITEERKYRGIIRDFQDDNIVMQVGRRGSSTKINLDDVKEIQLLGF
jgi:Spore coat protein CotO